LFFHGRTCPLLDRSRVWLGVTFSRSFPYLACCFIRPSLRHFVYFFSATLNSPSFPTRLLSPRGRKSQTDFPSSNLSGPSCLFFFPSMVPFLFLSGRGPFFLFFSGIGQFGWLLQRQFNDSFFLPLFLFSSFSPSPGKVPFGYIVAGFWGPFFSRPIGIFPDIVSHCSFAAPPPLSSWRSPPPPPLLSGNLSPFCGPYGPLRACHYDLGIVLFFFLTS